MALVQLMVPGLAFFYAGLMRSPSVITMMVQNYSMMGLVTIIWLLVGFSLCFGEDRTLFGDITTFWGFKVMDDQPLEINGMPLWLIIQGLPSGHVLQSGMVLMNARTQGCSQQSHQVTYPTELFGHCGTREVH